MSTESHTMSVPLTWNGKREIGTAVVTTTSVDGQEVAKVTTFTITDDQAARDLTQPNGVDHLSIGFAPVDSDPTLCEHRPLGESGVDS